MQPSRSLILITLVWVLLGFCASLQPALQLLWLWGGAATAVVILVDFVVGVLLSAPEVERKLPGRFAMGVEQSVQLTLKNRSSLSLGVFCYDGIPAHAVSHELPWRGRLPGKGFVCIDYPVTMTERGMKEFGGTHLRVFSLLRLWSRRFLVGESQTTRVYPNYEPVLRYALLAMAHRAEQMGIVKKKPCWTEP